MKNENVIKMARLMVGCTDRTCEDCLSQSKKLFGDNKCALIEYAEVLDRAGYRKQSDVAREFGEHVIKPISQVEQTASVREKSAENDYLKNYFQGYRIGCATAIIKIKEVAKEYGVEMEQIISKPSKG